MILLNPGEALNLIQAAFLGQLFGLSSGVGCATSDFQHLAEVVLLDSKTSCNCGSVPWHYYLSMSVRLTCSHAVNTFLYSGQDGVTFFVMNVNQ